MMYQPNDTEFFNLFIPDVVENACDYISRLDDPAPKGSRQGMAEALVKLLHAPVGRFVARLHETGRGMNATEYEAAENLRASASDIAKELMEAEIDGVLTRMKSHELADRLRVAWLTFIAYAAAYRMYDDLPRDLEKKVDTSKRQRNRAQKPRKNITKEDLNASRRQYEIKYKTIHGWITSACHEFNIDSRTLKKRLAKR